MRGRFFELLSRLRGLLTGRVDDPDFQQEMHAHLDLATEEHIRRGLPPEEARRQAALALGNLGQLQEGLREQRGVRQGEALWQDLRYGWRTLMKSPGFTCAAVATLALGIGANTTIFSVVNTVFLKPLPYPEPERLVNVWRANDGESDRTSILSAPNFLDWERQNHVFEHMALFDSAGKGYNLSDGKDAELVKGLRVSAALFPLLGVKPHLGRTFSKDEEMLGRHRVVVLSYGLWQRRFGGDRSLVGRTTRIDGETYTVVGVMPPKFGFDFFSGRNDLWVPPAFDEGDLQRDSQSFGSCARLKPGVSLAQARLEMDIIGRRLAREHPQTNAGQTVTLTPMSELGTSGRVRDTLVVLFTLVGFVLLIACVNVANLMLARGASREREFALRRALGAGRGRIVRQLLTESVLLSLLGGLAGTLIALAGTKALERVLPGLVRIPFRSLDELPIDGWVFAFALVLCGLTGIAFGLVSAYGVVWREQVSSSLKEGASRAASAGRGQLRYALAAAEVALALAVLVGAGLMLESLSRLLGVDPGLDPKNVLTLGMALPQKVLYTSAPDKPAFCRELTERVGSLPGVVSVGAISHLPIGGGNAGRAFVIDGQPDPGLEDQPTAAYGIACPGYFQTMGIPLVAGREFHHTDMTLAVGVVVINQALARRYWGRADAVGARIRLTGGDASKSVWLTVVGVSRDILHDGLDNETSPHLYRPYPQAGWPNMTVVAKTVAEPVAFATAVKRALRDFDSDQGTSEAGTMAQVVERSMGSRQVPAALLACFGLLSLVLAAVGIAGVVGYSVAQRTHEIGIRMALGASTREVLRLVMAKSMAWTLGGVVAGIGASYGVTRLLGGLLYGVAPMDPRFIASAAALLTLVAVVASYLPARRAARVDPVIALRCD